MTEGGMEHEVDSRLFRELVDRQQEAVCLLLPDLSRCVYANKSFERYFGLSSATGCPNHEALRALVHPDDREALRQYLTNPSRWSSAMVLRAVPVAGEPLKVSCQVIPLALGSEDPQLLALTSLDIQDASTEAEELRRTSQELEQRVAEKTEELQAAVRELEGFTYSVSHDLRGPLRSIMASAMILKEDFEGKLGTEADDQLDRMAKAAKKMATLIDELLKISRLNRQEMAAKPLDLTALAQDAARESARPDRIQVEEGLTAVADERLMRLVLLNLFDNAVKFVPKGQDPVVEFGQDDVSFFVRDQGIGFEQEYSERVFKPFERLVLDAEYPGTGVGLANVQRIIQRHGGRVWAESQTGKGTTIRFTL